MAGPVGSRPVGGTQRIDITQVDYLAPDVPSIIKDGNGDQHAQGLVPRSAVDQDLELIVPPWDFSMDPVLTDFIDIGWRLAGAPFVSVKQYRFDPPIAPGPKTCTVPVDKLVHGVYDLSYTKTTGGNAKESLKITVTVDREAPNDNQDPFALIFPPELNGVITDDYLTQYGEVRAQVPRYTGPQAQDRAVYYWTDKNLPPDDEAAIREQEFSQEDIDNNQMAIVFYEADIRNAGQGRRYAYYRLRDLAGNRGPRSTLSSILVDLTPAPENLKPPRIPLSARGLIDREQAREGANNEGGVTVEIDQYDNADSTQKILINWDGTQLNELDVDPAAFPLRAYVPWPVLRAKGLGPLTAEVDYVVRRGTLETPSSPQATAPVNLTIAGQDHANAPALLNISLAKLDVRGKISDIPNTLTALDYGLDATATLALYDNPQPLEVIEVFWGSISQAAARYSVQSGDVGGQLISVEIPWAVIEPELNNRALPVYYTTSNGVNQQQARITEVDVSIVLIEGLPAPEFPHANLFGYLNCCAVPRLWEGVTVRVAGHAEFSANDRVELTWQGCNSLNGSNPIPGVIQTFIKTLSASEAADGFDIVVVPYDTLIEPMEDNGSATAQYALYKTSGGFGRSDMDFVKITRKMPSGESCSPTQDLCED
ncbi:hypothetical protein QN382_20560 [Pseudomonas sp. 10B1]|uniref:hypothetical protein n=1 Tax=unclassified Pseudomonas TaxID=196821 RepID=UPI002AB4EC75|nr:MULTISPECIES: hypothetical protein [unclassified Pseudomonas]MDY7561186.1 hypothetical protein [Pseudomonas sp. AB6]MEA9996003.1 hypothetical protein [Pseudomonas sp. AA4]MEB0089457.1 hypothetical protein [Pseudomonas sp. RTI1]MEB0127804.1 hypothetical protein [Pseudomonas sp. CCC1.2]MEB0154113.1 hypothetical protein [Pseudomonas sp. CCC4.3]